ncbi:hypothetical protein LY76DRAFT_116558 [Colletotrichum caudatum]|nr:hypothetical protein LY76DRAFT_116558 [Colletotrichum caudatum]
MHAVERGRVVGEQEGMARQGGDDEDEEGFGWLSVTDKLSRHPMSCHAWGGGGLEDGGVSLVSSLFCSALLCSLVIACEPAHRPSIHLASTCDALLHFPKGHRQGTSHSSSGSSISRARDTSKPLPVIIHPAGNEGQSVRSARPAGRSPFITLH